MLKFFFNLSNVLYTFTLALFSVIPIISPISLKERFSKNLISIILNRSSLNLANILTNFSFLAGAFRQQSWGRLAQLARLLQGSLDCFENKQ